MSSSRLVANTQVLLLREKDTSHLSASRSFSLPSQQSPRQLVLVAGNVYAVSEDGDAYSLTEGSLESIRVPQAVRMIACNETAVLALTETGVVYGHGSDPDSNGFLCGISSLPSPAILDGFTDLKITQIGIGKTHAAALDKEGKLWTWGYGPSGQLGRSSEFPHPRPAMVDSANVFSGKTLICGPQVTSVITSGGFLYLFGSIGGHGTVSAVTESLRHLRNSFSRSLSAAISVAKPVSLPGLQNKFVVTAVAGNGFFAVLTDSGEVYFFDDCLDVVRLPTQSSSRVSSLGSFSSGLYGLAPVDRLLYQWTEPDLCPMTKNLMQTLSSAGHCQLLAWAGKTFSIASQYTTVSLRPNSEEIAVVVDSYTESRAFAYLLSELTPYKRSQYISNLMKNFYDSLGKWKSGSQQVRESPTPFISRASPIPFANHDSSDFSLLSFDPYHEKSYENFTTLADCLQRIILLITFRRLKRREERSKDDFPLYKLLLPNTLSAISTAFATKLRLFAWDSIQNYAQSRTKQREIQRIYSQKARDEGTKSFFRLITSHILRDYHCVFDRLLSIQIQNRRKNRKRDAVLSLLIQKRESRIRKWLVKSLFIWKTDIVKFYIKLDGLKKLAGTLRKKVVGIAFNRVENYHRKMTGKCMKFAAFLTRKSVHLAKIQQNRFFTRWKDITTRVRLFSQRRIHLLTSGARAFTSRFKLFLRKALYRPVISHIKSSENRLIFLSALKYPLVFLDMKVKKAQRRLTNYAFNRVFQCQKDPKWGRYREALGELGNLCAGAMRPVFNDLIRDSDASFIRMVVGIVPFVTLLSKKATLNTKSAWGKLIDHYVHYHEDAYDLETLRSWQQPADFPDLQHNPNRQFATVDGEALRTPSPQKAQLRIPSLTNLSPSIPQSPGIVTDRSKYHRSTTSNKLQTPKTQDNKPPWRRPSAAVSFASASQVISPRCRRAQYDQKLKTRQTRQKSSNARSVDPARTRSPERLRSPESIVTSPTNAMEKTGRGIHTPRNDISGFSSVYALSTIASPRDGSSPMRSYSRGRPVSRPNVQVLIRACHNLLFNTSFRAFAGLKSFPGHSDSSPTILLPKIRSDEDLEVDWHKRIYLIGSERVKRLLKEMVGRRLKDGWSNLTG